MGPTSQRSREDALGIWKPYTHLETLHTRKISACTLFHSGHVYFCEKSLSQIALRIRSPDKIQNVQSAEFQINKKYYINKIYKI